MAEVVDKLPEKQSGRRKGEVNWRSYLDGRVWKLVIGKDVPNYSASQLRSGFLGACRNQGIKGTTRIIDGVLYVQAFTSQPAPPYGKKRKPGV